MAFKVGYFLRESATNLRRNKLMTAAAVLTAAIALVLLGGVMLIGDLVQGFTGELEERVEVQVFLAEEITEDQQADIRDTLTGLDVVGGVDYISKAEAYEEWRERYANEPVLIENVDEETLPASFRVAMDDPERVDVIRSKVGDNPAVEEIVDQRETVAKLLNVTGLLRTFSAVMVVVLFVAAVLLIANTIQLAIYARRQEIEIMKLVGATNWFVRVPFMVEGLVQGLIGAVIALVLLTIGKSFVRGALPVFIPTGQLGSADPVRMAWLVFLGMAIGVLGSAVALRRYLEV